MYSSLKSTRHAQIIVHFTFSSCIFQVHHHNFLVYHYTKLPVPLCWQSTPLCSRNLLWWERSGWRDETPFGYTCRLFCWNPRRWVRVRACAFVARRSICRRWLGFRCSTPPEHNIKKKLSGIRWVPGWKMVEYGPRLHQVKFRKLLGNTAEN